MDFNLCGRCSDEKNKELATAVAVLGGDVGLIRMIHEHAHLREDLAARERQLHELQCAGKKVLVDWEKNLTEAVQELSCYVPDVCVCPWCDGPILDPNANQSSVCPHDGCGHNLIKYLNKYHCDDCNTSWEDQWSSQCDDECPKCGVDTSPHESEEIEQHD